MTSQMHQSTAQVAASLGIQQSGLQRLIRESKVPAPRVQRIAGVRVRLWTRADVTKLRRALAARKGRRVTQQMRRAAQIARRWRRRWIFHHTLNYGTDGGHQPREIMTPAEVAQWLRVPESWVYEKTRRRCGNPLPCLRIGRYIRFDRRRIARWLEGQVASEGSAQ